MNNCYWYMVLWSYPLAKYHFGGRDFGSVIEEIL